MVLKFVQMVENSWRSFQNTMIFVPHFEIWIFNSLKQIKNYFLSQKKKKNYTHTQNKVKIIGIKTLKRKMT